MPPAATAEDHEHHDKNVLSLGGEQHGIDDAILARPVGYPGVPDLSLDDSPFGEDAPSHVVQIGLVLLCRLDLDHLGHAGYGIGNGSHIAPQHSDLLLPAPGLDPLDPRFADGGIALLSSDLELPLAPGRNQLSARGLPSHLALPTHIFIPQIAEGLQGTEFKCCGKSSLSGILRQPLSHIGSTELVAQSAVVAPRPYAAGNLDLGVTLLPGQPLPSSNSRAPYPRCCQPSFLLPMGTRGP